MPSSATGIGISYNRLQGGVAVFPPRQRFLPAAEAQGGVEFVFDLEEGVQHHGPALVHVDRVGRQVRFLAAGFRVEPVHFERLDVLRLGANTEYKQGKRDWRYLGDRGGN